MRRRITNRLERVRPYRAVLALPQRVRGPGLKTAVYRKAFLRLPIRRGLMVFESHMGTQYSDSPRAVYEALRRSGLPHRAVWSHAGDATGFPTTARHVLRGSWRYYYTLARAEFWIDNQGLPRQFDKPTGTTYIQTWHGTALKKMGFDTELRHRPLERQREFEGTVNRWDYLCVQNEFSVNTFVPAFRYRGEILRIGLPRNDVLVTGGDAERVAAVRRTLDIPPDRKVLLYAPTFRDIRRRRGKPFEMRLNLADMQEALEGEYVLLVRTHYLDEYRLPARSGTFARDVSGYHDITDLLLLADVLITDFSSVMFDYANLRRPMIFFTYDYADYVGTERGLYLDLSEIAPGPLVEDPDEVTALISDLGWRSTYAERYDAFVRQFCEYDVGKASEAVVERVIAGRS
jgi:CDP-glycerol glycerophosphotransferase